MAYWCVMTIKYDSTEWTPIVSTLSRTKKSAIKKYGTDRTYFENNLKSGKARVVPVEVKEIEVSDE